MGEMTKFGAVAAGHPLTAETAGEILADGGNAFDAALGAMCTATVVEPVLASFGGGGFLMARPAEGAPQAFDFFAQTPMAAPEDCAASRDFYPIVADFGAAQQEFHIGMGAIATPGAVHGLFAAHEALGRLPMRRLMEPAMEIARRGFVLSPFQAYLFGVVGPIYTVTEGARRIFAVSSPPSGAERAADDGQPAERLIGEGDRFRNPDTAHFMDALCREGPDLFYRGEVGQRIVADCRDGGGLLRGADLAAYGTRVRAPLSLTWRDAEIFTNPPPSTGGLLIAFALELLRGVSAWNGRWGAPAHLTTLVRVMAASNRARRQENPEAMRADDRARMFLSPDLVDAYRNALAEHPQTARGTTHISVVDRAGNAAALTLSNGEGAGYVVPGTGVMMNNMLGEEDINPTGFDVWPRDRRMGSMMAPTVMHDASGLTVLGSGGSNRIRTAVLQVIVNLAAFGMTAEAAVAQPRAHFERGHLDLEPGWPEDAVAALPPGFEDRRDWPERNLFFGGVHMVRLARDGTAEAAGDPRRAGHGLVR